MVAKTSQARARVARKAALKRHHPELDTADLDREIRIDSLAEHIRRVVDAAPPLTPEQRDRLAVLLRPALDGGGRT
jgi:hypothetical protein